MMGDLIDINIESVCEHKKKVTEPIKNIHYQTHMDWY